MRDTRENGNSSGNDEDVSRFEGDVLVDGYEMRHSRICQQMLTMLADYSGMPEAIIKGNEHKLFIHKLIGNQKGRYRY